MKRFCLLMVLLCSYRIASANPVYLSGRPYREKYLYFDSLMQMDAEAFSARIKGLLKWASAENEDELYGEFLLIKLKRKFRDGDSLAENELHKIALHAHENEQIYLEAKALQAIGDYNSKYRKYAHAAEYFNKAYAIYSGFPASDFPDKRDYLYNLGSAYRNYGDYEKAIGYFREAITSPEPHNAQAITIENSLGVCYRYIHRYDSAAWFFARVYEKATRENDSAWIGIGAGNIGITYFLQGRYDDAVPLLEKDIALSIATTQIQNAANSMVYLGTIFYLRKDFDAAESLLRRALRMSQARQFWPNYELAVKLYGTLSKIYAAERNMELAYRFADSTIIAKDSALSVYNTLNLSKAVEKSALEEQKLQTEKLEHQQQQQILVRNFLIISIVLLTVIGLLLTNRHRLARKKLEAEKKNAEHDLADAARQLSTVRESAQQKDSLIEIYTTELERIRQNPELPTDEEVLTQLENATILTDDQWNDFRKLFEKVHKNFFVNLKKKHPELSQAETRFMALARLKLSSKEMASMLGVSANTIRIYRYRLRKKLNLDKEDMLEELVDTI